MDIVAIVALVRSVEEEAPLLAAELGLTVYEAALILRAPPPVIVLRSDDRARTVDVLGKLRGRGHDVVACELDAVVASEDMFCPKSFRFDAGEFVGIGNGEERRLPLTDILALVRANHRTRIEDTTTSQERKLSLGRAAMSGGLIVTKVTSTESKRVKDEREAVLYVFRNDAAPWLLLSTQMRYDGLAEDMRRSQIENFEVLVKTLRELSSPAPFDARLLSIRAAPTVTAAGPKHLTASSSGTLDILAHVVAMSIGKAARPYR